MNDHALAGHCRQFETFLIGLCLLLALSAGALGLAHGWQTGFVTAQAASRLLPGLFWESVTTLGDERMLLALLLPFALRYPRVFWAIIVASLIAALLCRGLKLALPMPRPAAVLDAGEITVLGARLTRHSFPSGHTAAAFAAALVWVAWLGGQRGLPLLLLATLAGFSRVAVGAHWPLDVLAGAGVGCLAAWAGLAVTRRFRWGLRSRVHWSLVAVATLAVASLPFDGQGYPGSFACRLLFCLVGLAAVGADYLLPLLRHGWPAASRPTGLLGQAATKA